MYKKKSQKPTNLLPDNEFVIIKNCDFSLLCKLNYQSFSFLFFLLN